MELADDLNVCEDEGYAKPEHLSDLKADAAEVARLLNGFINYLQREAKTKKEPPGQSAAAQKTHPHP